MSSPGWTVRARDPHSGPESRGWSAPPAPGPAAARNGWGIGRGLVVAILNSLLIWIFGYTHRAPRW